MSEGPRKQRKQRFKERLYTANRRLQLKGKLLKRAEVLLAEEQKAKAIEREAAINEAAPRPKVSGLSVKELQELCKDLHQKIDTVDEVRYDMELKVAKNDKEIEELTAKVLSMKGQKRPNLKRVKKGVDLSTAEAKLSSKADFKANLKTVKKEEEKKEEVTDWRKNVEALSGMEGRKKLFAQT